MIDSTDKNLKTCFIVTPIGSDKSDIRRHADGVIKSVIRPLLMNKLEFKEVVAAHEISKSGSINNQVMNSVIDYDLVIVNLTGLNPNVMYELAVRHTTQKPIIHICEKDTTILPFDIVDQRTIFYTNDMLGVQELSDQLSKMINLMNNDTKCDDNPIYNSKRQQSIYKELEEKSGENNILKYIMTKLDDMNENSNKFNPNFISKQKIDLTDLDEKLYLYNEEFNVQIKSFEPDFNIELFKTELYEKISKKYNGAISYEQVKEESFSNFIYLYFKLIIRSNTDIPVCSELENLINNLFFNAVSVEKIEGIEEEL